MAKLTRAKQEIFGSTGATTEFGVFGSDSEGAAATTKDPALIQSLDTFKRGLYGATASATEPPRIQDINALYYLLSRQIAYGQQAGIPEWDATENYYANASAVIGSDGKVYISKTGTDGSPNINNNPVSDGGTNWRYLWASTDFSPYPLSHLTRAMQINGDGVPTFPDNVAGRVYFQDAWATTDSWSVAGVDSATLSVGEGVLKATATGSKTYCGMARSVTPVGKEVVARVRSSNNTTVVLSYDQSGWQTFSSTALKAGVWQIVSGFVPATASSSTLLVYKNDAVGTLEIDAIYVGSGLYDTPVYDKACCNRFTNNGVLPVKGNRGQALSFNGAQSLVADNPVIGTSGTIAFWIKRRTVGTDQIIVSNDTAPARGMSIRFNTANEMRVALYNGTAYGYGTRVLSDTASWHSVVITYNASALIFNIDGVDVETIASPQVPTLATAVLTIGSAFNGEMSPIEYDTAIWTLAQKQRFYNGDDVVDSQQKSNSGTPHAMAVYGADGGLKAHDGATVWDSSNDGTGSGLNADLVRGATPSTDGLSLLGVTLGSGRLAEIQTPLSDRFGPDGWPRITGPLFGLTAQVGTGLTISSTTPALCRLNSTDIAFSGADSLRTYRWNGSTWSLLGTALTISASPQPALCALNSTDVAFIDANHLDLRVYRWNTTALTWSQIGSGLTLTGVGTYFSICALNTVDIAFMDNALDTLKTYRWNGTVFAQVGTGLALTGGHTRPALCALNSTDIVLIDSAQEYLRTYRWNGSTWSLLGTEFFVSGVDAPAICTLNSTTIAFIDDTNENFRVYRWNTTALTWSQIGSGLTLTGVGSPALCALNTTDVAFIDGALDSLRVYKTI
jgi:hypothetical protein